MPTIGRPTSRNATRAGLLLCIFLQVFIPSHASFTLNIEPKEEECFFVSYPHGPAMLFGNYDLLDGTSPLPFSLVVMDTKKERVMFRSKKGAREGTFRVNLKEGQKASICLQNSIPPTGRKDKQDDLERVVGFQFTVEPRNEAIELQVQNGRLIKSTQDLTRELSTLQSHHDYMRTREALHREVVERTFSSLLWWVVIEAVTLILVAAGQVLYFRRFLERRRYI